MSPDPVDQTSLQYLERFVAHLSHPVTVIDHGRIRLYNRAAASSASIRLDKTLRDLPVEEFAWASEEDSERFQQLLSKAGETGQVAEDIFSFPRNGEDTPAVFHFAVHPVDEEVYVLVAYDETQRAITRAQVDLLQHSTDMTPNALFIATADEAGDILYGNRKFDALFGPDTQYLEEIYERLLSESVVNHNALDTIQHVRDQYVPGRTIVQFSQNGGQWYDLILNVHQRDGGHYVYGTMVDMTDLVDNETRSISKGLRTKKRISRDLHDYFSSTAAGLAIIAKTIAEEADELDAPELAKSANYLVDHANTFGEKLQSYIESLVVYDPQKQSLQEAIRQHLDEVEELFGIETYFTSDLSQTWPYTDEDKEHIFAIVHEALGNAIKHAQPTELTVSFSRREDSLQIRITDNGTGFEPSLVEQGNGIANMNGRARALSASLSFSPRSSGGTIVNLLVPLPS